MIAAMLLCDKTSLLTQKHAENGKAGQRVICLRKIESDCNAWRSLSNRDAYTIMST